MPRLTLSPGGPLLGPDGQPFEGPHADATQIDVPHHEGCQTTTVFLVSGHSTEIVY
jgi:hypothetical protein